MSSEPTTQAVIYGAKSSPDEKGSIADQLRVVREKAERKGREVVGEHEDENASAWSQNRGPGLEAALGEAEDLGAELWVLHSDRLCRGDGVQARHLVQLVLEAKAAGIRLRSVEDDSSLDNVLMAAAMGERNTEDSRRKSEATKAGLARRRAKGKHLGKRSLGYSFKRLSLDDDERTMVIDPTEAAAIRRIYGAYRAGQTQLGIARDLMADGVRTVNGGTEWYQGTVRRILTNPIYAGMIRDGDEMIEGVHEAIIERAEWQEAQDLLAKKAVVYDRGRPPAGNHLFRNAHLRCECGAAMVPRTEGPRQAYRCNRRSRDSSACSMPEVRRSEVDGAVYEYFTRHSLDIQATRQQLQEARDHKLAEVGALLDAAEREVAELDEAITGVERDYTRRKLEVEEWKRITANLTSEREGAEAERDRLRDQLAQVETDSDFLDTEAEVIEELAKLREAIAGQVTDAAGIEAVRAVLLRLFDGFVLRRQVVRCEPTDGTGVYVDDHALEGERWIEPLPSAQAIEGYDEQMRPVLARKPLDKAVDNYAPSSVSA